MSKFPPDDIFEGLYKLRIRESAQLKTALEVYDMAIHQKMWMPNYQELKTMVTRSKDQKLRFPNFHVMHGKIETGAVLQSRKDSCGVERRNGTCYQREGKDQCPKGLGSEAISVKISTVTAPSWSFCSLCLYLLLLAVLSLGRTVLFFIFWFSHRLWLQSRWYGPPALVSQRVRSSLFSFQFAQCLEWNHTSQLHLEDLPLDLQR